MATRKKIAKAKAKPAAKKSAKKFTRKVMKLPAKKSPQEATAKNDLPRPSSKAWGQAGRALDGVRILDFTHVQSGPTCTQLLAYMGADVIKVERPGTGDITRGQLRDVKGTDSLYFTMLNGSKRSITIDSKHPRGREILDRLVKAVRRSRREFCARRARSHGAYLRPYPQAQSADDRGLGERLWSGTL